MLPAEGVQTGSSLQFLGTAEAASEERSSAPVVFFSLFGVLLQGSGTRRRAQGAGRS